MKFWFKMSLVLFLLLVPFCVQGISKEPAISVGLAQGVSSCAIRSNNMTFYDASGKQVNMKGTVTVKSGGRASVIVGGKSLALPVTVRSKGLLYLNDKPYRGVFVLVASSGSFTVVNELPLEDYLKGVLKMEVNPSWPAEVLRAQAITARTYALAEKGRHGSAGFDLCATDHCIPYRGVNAEDPKLTHAIESTRGMVLLYQGKPARTFFHSDSGGWTTDVQSVWGADIPYLKPVQEPFQYQSPYSSWSFKISGDELGRRLSQAGINVGSVFEIIPVKIGPGDRVEMVEVVGTKGRKTIKSHELRMALGAKELKSTVFSLDGDGGTTRRDVLTASEDFINESQSDSATLISLTQEGAFTSDELMDMLLHPEKRGEYLKKALARRGKSTAKTSKKSQKKDPKLLWPQWDTSADDEVKTRGVRGTTFLFQGKGWGHGGGMYQWGAKAMAENGWPAEKIVRYYYPGTELRKLY